MWYWIIAGSIFLFLEVVALLSLNLEDKYRFICDTIDALLIALLFPLVIVFIISSFISSFIVSILKKFKRKN